MNTSLRLLLVLCLAVPGCTRYQRDTPRSDWIASSGGTPMQRTNFGRAPYHLQFDTRWSAQTVGGSDEPLSAVGCTLCCVSMALTHLGIALDPGRLNAELKRRGGYTERGWLRWKVAAAVAGGGVRVEVPERPSHERIDRAILAGEPVIAKVMLRGEVPHWVLIVGKAAREYVVKDPLDAGKTLRRLSALSGRIYAIRVLGRSEVLARGG